MDSEAIDRIAERLAAAEATGELFESNRDLLTPEAAEQLRAIYPGIPEDYLLYLQRVGAGSILSCSYAVYSPPIKPEEIFGSHDAAWPADLLAFGDNFSGDVGVFEPSSKWAVGELWHESRELVRGDNSFTGFMESIIDDLSRG